MNNSVEYRKGYTLTQVSKELDLHRHTIYSWVSKGLIRAVRLPTGRFRVSQEELSRVKELVSGRQNSS